MEYGIPVSLDTPLGTIDFNAPASARGYFRLSAFDGMDGASVRNNVDPVPQRDGALVYPAYRGARFPVLQGQIVFPDGNLTTRRQGEDNLRAYTDSILRADGTLRFTPTGAAERRLTVRLLEALQIRTSGDAPLGKEFQLALVAGDPRVYSSALTSTDTSTLVGGGGGTWTIPFSIPFSFGTTATGGAANVTNNGNAPTFPVVRIYGPVSSPYVVNTTNGGSLSLPGLQLAAGDYAEVDMAAETIRLNGSATSSLLAYLDVANSTFWQLEVGANAIQFSGAGPGAGTHATIIYRDAYV